MEGRGQVVHRIGAQVAEYTAPANPDALRLLTLMAQVAEYTAHRWLSGSEWFKDINMECVNMLSVRCFLPLQCPTAAMHNRCNAPLLPARLLPALLMLALLPTQLLCVG